MSAAQRSIGAWPSWFSGPAVKACSLAEGRFDEARAVLALARTLGGEAHGMDMAGWLLRPEEHDRILEALRLVGSRR
jgi:hypothetical protein